MAASHPHTFVRTYSDGTERYNTADGIPFLIASGGMTREAIDTTIQAVFDVVDDNVNEAISTMYIDVRKLQGMTPYMRQAAQKVTLAFPTHKVHFTAILLGNSITNRLLAIFLNSINRLFGGHVNYRIFQTEEQGLEWLRAKRAEGIAAPQESV